MSLYDVQEVTTLSCNSKDYVSSKQIISSQSYLQDIAVINDSSLSIISHDDTALQKINLDCMVDALSWSGDGLFLLLADSSGTLHIVSKRLGKVIFSKSIHNTDDLSDQCSAYFCAVVAIQATQSGVYNIAAAMNTGLVSLFLNVPLQLIDDGNMDRLRTIKNSIETSTFDTGPYHCNKIMDLSAQNLGNSLKFYTSGFGDDLLVCWESNQTVFAIEEKSTFKASITASKNFICGLPGNSSCTGFVNIYPVYNSIFCLDNEGYLYQFEANYLFLLRWWHNQHFIDCAIRMPALPFNLDKFSIGRVYGLVRDSHSNTHISVFGLPDLKEICHFNIGKTTRFCSAPCKVGDVFWTENALESVKDDQVNLVVKSICAASPDNRLLILLHQHKFEEAVSFAKKYNLDLQDVYKQQASSLLHAMPTVSDGSGLKIAFEKFQECANRITDPVYVAELCMSVTLPDISTTYKLLSLARDHIDGGGRSFKASVSSESSNVSDFHIRQQIDKLLDLLATFQIAFSQEESSMWSRFRQQSLPQVVALLLKSGTLIPASVLCSRHEAELVCHLEQNGADSLKSLLNIIPEDSCTDELVNWLENVIPSFLVSTIPNVVEILAEWLHSRAEALEEIFPEHWPHNGLKLANAFFKIQRQLSTTGSFREELSATYLIHKQKCDEVAKLQLLMSRLQLLSKLQNQYHCQVSLNELTKETTTSLTFRMLDKVGVPELIPKCLDNTVRPYMREHKLNEDETLLQYVEEVLAHCRDNTRGAFHSLRERKVVAVIKCLNTDKVVVRAVCCLAKKASIPWSKDVRSLVEKALALTETSKIDVVSGRTSFEAMQVELHHYGHLERIPSITAKYNLRNFVNRDNSGKERFLRYLINQDTDEAFEDALEVAHTFAPSRHQHQTPKQRVYVYRIHRLIKHGKISECVEILKTNEDLAETLVDHMTLRTSLTLEETHVMWDEERANYCLAARHMIEYMLRDYPGKLEPGQRCELDEQLVTFRNIHALQTKYDERLSLQEYSPKENRDAILNKHIVSYYGKDSSSTQGAIVHTNVSEFGDHNNLSVVNQSKRDGEAEATDDNKHSASKRHDTFASVIFLARLLKVPQQTMQSTIALQAAKKCQVTAAINLCRDLYTASPCPATAKTLQRVSHILFKQLESHTDEIARQLPDIRDLVGAATTCCHRNDLLDAINLFSLTNIACEVYLATDMNTQDLLSQCVSTGPKVRRSKYEHSEWIHNWYHEADGLNLRASDVLPLVAKLRDCLLTSQGKSLACTQPSSMDKCKFALGRLGDVSMQLATHLKSGRHCILALYLIITCLYKTISHLMNHKLFYQKDGTARKIMSDLIIPTVKQAKSEIKGYMEILIEKVLLSRDPDVPFAAGLLLDLESDQAFQLLNNLQQGGGKNVKRILGVAQTGLAVARLKCAFNHIPRFESLLLDAKWAQELSPMQISAENFVNSAPQWKQKFLLRIIVHPEITGLLILNYCRDYNLDQDQALIQYAKVLLGADLYNAGDGLSPISPGTSLVSISQTSAAMLAVGQSFKSVKTQSTSQETKEKFPWNKVKEELKWLVQKIRDKFELRRQLEKCFRNHLSPYDYDRAEFLLYVIDSCNASFEGSVNVNKGLRLIESLRNVKRRKPPTDIELQRMWNPDQRENLTNKALPKLAKARLPLHPFLFCDSNQSWKILTAEVDEFSASFLAPAAKLLKMDVDTLYLTAAENVIKLYTAKDGERELPDSELLEKIRKLTECMENFQMAVAMAKRVSEVLPSGVEKVLAYKWCITLVNRWLEEISENSTQHKTISNALQTLAWNYKQADTYLQLKENQLETPELRSLINKPTDLMVALYKHPSILQRFFEPGNRYPDIHHVANRLAEIHNVDVGRLRRALIYQLLLAADKPDSNDEEDSTVVIEQMRTKALAQSSTQHGQDEEETIFLLYILSHDSSLQQAQLLVRWIGDHKNKKFTNPCRVRALKCLFHVADNQMLLSLCDKTAEQLRSELRVLVYLTELEAANFKITGSNLKRSEKSSVARSIIASPAHRHNPLALRVAADMCREFGSVSSDTWVVLLQQLVSLQQVSYLQQLLPEICRSSAVRSLSCLPSVWQSCVTLPLVALTPPLDENQINVALASYHFLLKCPVLLRTDLANVAQHFEVINLYALALACLLISPGEQEQAKTLALNNEREMHRQLLYLHSEERPLMGYGMIQKYLRKLQDMTTH